MESWAAAFVAVLCVVPACAMMLGSFFAFAVLTEKNKQMLSMTQHFSAGILIAAIGSELVPKLQLESTGHLGTLAIAVGFFGGVALMMSVEQLAEKHEEAKHDSSKLEVPASATVPQWCASRLEQLTKALRASEQLHMAQLLESLTAQDSKKLAAPVPWTTAVPVYIDSWMDGLLIGIVAVASTHAGYVMALATTIEMGFLGVTFGAMLKECGPKKWPTAALAPFILILGGLVGASFAEVLAENRIVFSGVVAFGASALLFLTTNELLKEARENMDKEDDYLRVWLFVGFFFIIAMLRTFPG